MSTYVVAADNIDGKEQSYIQTVIKKLEAKGHTCENLGVGPSKLQNYGLSRNSTGKIGVFIVGGSDIGTYVDIVTGLKNGYYHYKYVWFCFASNTATTDKWITCSGLTNTPLVRAHDDNFSSSSSISAYIGKPAKTYFSANKQYINYVCGSLGCTFDSIASKLANGGNEDEKESSASSIKEALKEVLSDLDGEVECKVINDKVYVNKIPEPESSYALELVEGINIAHDSISITDYNPDTINKLIVHWENGEDIIYIDDKLMERFGEKVSEVDAVKTITVTETKESNTETASSEDSDATEESESITTTTTKEVPVETYEEAETFAKTEWAKIRRDNGHVIECKVPGSPEWKHGEWVKVHIPSFEEDGFMYITKVSHSDSPNSGWQCSLTLTDYPPSLSKPKESDSNDEEEDETIVEETT